MEVCAVSTKNAVHKSAIMGIDEIQISVVVDSVLDIKGGDYVVCDDINYTLNGVVLMCYLDTEDVEIIHPADTRVTCVFNDYKVIIGVPTNKFILKVPVDKVAEYTNIYSQLAQGGVVNGDYQIVGY